MQYVFLNGRHIRDRALGHALTEAYRGLLTVGRHPIGFLFWEMPANLVDVNVHPTKLEVRFRDGGRHYSHLLSTLRTQFLTTNLEHQLVERRSEDPAATPAASDPAAEQARQQLVSWVQSQLPPPTATPGVLEEPVARPPTADWRSAPVEPLELHRIEPAREEPAAAPFVARGATPATGRSSSDEPLPMALQVGNRYLVTSEGDGVVIIDQHALHERVLYEQFRERVLAGKVESQKLLVPESVDLAPEEAAALLSESELLVQLGLRVEPFGQSTVLVTSYPAIFKQLAPAELVRDVASQLLAGGRKPERRDLIDALLHMMSCKAAIKAGDRLPPEEIAELLRLRHLAQDSHHCPHGRPSALVLTREHLDRQFKRI